MLGSVLTTVEQVWRHLLVAAGEGQRRWPSVTRLADELGLAGSSVHQALRHPVEIGAVSVRATGGLRVLDPGRLLLLWAGRRHLDRDVRDRFYLPASAPVVERAITNPKAVLGGHGAVVARLGVNTIADYDRVIVYGAPRIDVSHLPDFAGRTGVLVLEPDPLLARYGRVTPLAQAWVDLFALPGWQAARFVHELLPRLVSEDAGLLPA